MGKRVLLQITTPEAIARLEKSQMEDNREIYYDEQHHSCLSDFLFGHLKQQEEPRRFIQVSITYLCYCSVSEL